MKKLVALASMAVLLCASASFAKQAMDEEEMDLVTAAGQPTVIDINVTTRGVGRIETETEAEIEVTANVNGNNGEDSASAELGSLEAESKSGILDFDADGIATGALNLDFSEAELETFSLSAGGTGTASLSATAEASTETTLTGASATVEVEYGNTPNVHLLIATSSQTNLRALTVNNVAGENQLANGINILSAYQNVGEGAVQSNEINQSWGSFYDWTFAPGSATATATSDAGEGGDGKGAPGVGQGGEIEIEESSIACILGTGCSIASNNTGGNGTGGDGGSASAAASAAYPNLPLTIAADQIIRVTVDSSGDADVLVSQESDSMTTLTINENSQTDLAALIVNNVAGLNQVASAINIASGGSIVIGTETGLAQLGFNLNGTSAGGTNSGHQHNTINQYRGAPLNARSAGEGVVAQATACAAGACSL